MIFKTIEFVPTDITTTIDSLQSDVTAGKYDDILGKYCFLTFTEKGLTLVKQDKSIITNTTVDLSEYVKSSDISKTYAKKTDIPNVSEFITTDILKDYVKTSDLPKFNFLEDGTLTVTINDITHKYAPILTD